MAMPESESVPVETGTIRSRVIPTQPDLNTTELATYGSTYLDVKSALYALDMLIDMAEERYAMAIASTYGSNYERVREILVRKPYVISAERPRTTCYEDFETFKRVKRIYRAASTVETLKRWRIEVEAYGAMVGTQEYGRKALENGLDPETIRRVIRKRASKGLVNSYESIQNLRMGRLKDTRTEEEKRLARIAEMALMANDIIASEQEEMDPEKYEALVNRLMKPSDTVPQEKQDGDTGDGKSEPYDSSVVDILGPHVLDTGIEESELDAGGGEVPEDDGPKIPVHGSDGMIGPDSTGPGEAVDILPFGDGEDQTTEQIARIPPASTGPADAAGIVPEHQQVERIGPDGTSPEEAMAVLESIFSPRLPEETPEWAAWYRTNFRERMHMDVDVYGEDDGGVVIIKSGGE